ncbi:MAG: hypothetical protein ACYCXT_11595 [Acidiferrobacteraceae bacterium]
MTSAGRMRGPGAGAGSTPAGDATGSSGDSRNTRHGTRSDATAAGPQRTRSIRNPSARGDGDEGIRGIRRRALAEEQRRVEGFLVECAKAAEDPDKILGDERHRGRGRRCVRAGTPPAHDARQHGTPRIERGA